MRLWPFRKKQPTCRFHGQAWSKTCQECNRCLDQIRGVKGQTA